MTKHVPLPLLLIEKYLEQERSSSVRHEYVAGRVFAMVGDPLGHNRVAVNITLFLMLAVEALSPSTESIDRRGKLLNYQKLPSLKEYMHQG